MPLAGIMLMLFLRQEPLVNLPLDPSTLLSAFASAFSQSNRLLRLNFAPGSGISEDVFLPCQLSGHEAINEGFNAYLPLPCTQNRPT